MVVRQITVDDLFDEAMPLFMENWVELKFDFPLKPSREAYQAMHDAGLLIVLGGFIEGELVGYSTALVAPHPFNQEVKFCATDSLFVTKSKRETSLGGSLIAHTERLAKMRGATHISLHTKAGTPLADVLSKHGYEPGDVVMVRHFKDN